LTVVASPGIRAALGLPVGTAAGCDVARGRETTFPALQNPSTEGPTMADVIEFHPRPTAATDADVYRDILLSVVFAADLENARRIAMDGLAELDLMAAERR
jgi:hypothetical protein